MSRNYSFSGSLTTPNSATLPIGTILATTAIRPRLFEVVLGSSSAPANNAGRFNITRNSTTGTAGSTPTPVPIDPGDPAATSTLGLAVFTVGPTLGNILLQWALNQQATFRWIASPGKELVAPATANNGLAFMNPAVNSTYTADFSLIYEE